MPRKLEENDLSPSSSNEYSEIPKVGQEAELQTLGEKSLPGV